MTGISDIVNVAQFEPLAAQSLRGAVWDYVSGGAGDERTLRRNPAAWQEIGLLPRILVDVSRIDTSLDLLGNRLAHPILLAPTALHTNYCRDGELETLRGAKAGEALYTQSSLGGTVLNDVGRVAHELNQPWWFQLYVQADRGWTEELVRRAIAEGASALVLTVDTPSLGARDRDKRDNLGAHAGQTFPILDGAPVTPDPTPAHRRIYNPHLSPSITWDDLEWLVSISDVPVLCKGVLRAKDATRTLDHGAAGVIVSNHGARNLDTAPATADVLADVADSVAGRAPIIVDGGIRRGTDVAKALALGATAVQIGRPYIWALTSFGAAGVQHVVEILRTELEMAMALLGAPALEDLGRDLLIQ